MKPLSQSDRSNRHLIRDSILQYAKTALCIVLALFLATVAVLEMLPQKDVGINVKERIGVSSSKIYADGSLYSTEIRGILINRADALRTVDSIRVVIGDSDGKRDVILPAVTLHPGAEYNLVHSFEGTSDFDTVHEVYLTMDGNEVRLSNRAISEFPLSGLAIFCLVLLIPAVFLTVRALKGCFYLRQERSQMR